MTAIPPIDPPPQGTPAPRTITFDWAEWLPYLDDMTATPEQKRALIESLWSIVMAFVDLGFEVAAPPETSGKLPDMSGDLARAMVNLKEKEGGHDTI